jgi:hypothetical protein
MAYGFRRMPIETKVAAGNGEIGGDGHLLAGAQVEQGAVVADAESEAWRLRGGPGANLAKDSQLAGLG